MVCRGDMGRARDVRFFEAEIISRLELVCLVIKFVFVQLAPWMTRSSFVLLGTSVSFVLTLANDLVVRRDMSIGSVDPSPVEDIAGARQWWLS